MGACSSFASGEGEGSAHGLISADLDLTTGLLRFADHYGLPDEPEEGQTLGLEAAVALGTDLVRRLYPLQIAELGAAVPEVSPDGGVSLFFPRIWEGIPVAQDGIHLWMTPDGRWRQIFAIWTGGEPEEPVVPRLSAGEATERLLAAWEPVLAWHLTPSVGVSVTVHLDDGLPEEAETGPWLPVRLAYLLQPRPEAGAVSHFLDATTGAFLDFQGRELGAESGVRAELQEVPGGRELVYVLDQLEWSELGGDIDPDRALTRGEALQFLFALTEWPLWIDEQRPALYTDIPVGHSLSPLVAKAVARGILLPAGAAPQLLPDEPVTRGEFAVFLARQLGLGRLSRSELEVVTSFRDLDGVGAEQRNAVAFLAALGVVEDGEQFRPADPITLAEAAVMTVNLARITGSRRKEQVRTGGAHGPRRHLFHAKGIQGAGRQKKKGSPPLGGTDAMNLTCPACGATWPLASGAWRCSCGAPLDLELGEPRLDPRAIAAGPPNLWRYAGALPPVAPEHRVSLGETITPLVELTWDGLPVRFKLDYLFPTGSYKDRANAVFVSALRAAGISEVVEDSSGNAGASLAAYCARAGMGCTIYVPAGTSPAKLLQIEAYGARVVKVPGPRAATAAAVQEAAATRFYASHNWNPIFIHGMKSLAFELWEQLGWQAPGAVVVPCGYGSVLLGSYLGFRDLLQAGAIGRLPRLYAVQAATCAPLHAALAGGDAATPAAAGAPAKQATGAAPSPCGQTLAEGIASPGPVRMALLQEAIQESGGAVLTVTESEILAGLRRLARQGLYVEPTSAVVAAALSQLAAAPNPPTAANPPTSPAPPAAGALVAVLTGSGLKATEKLLHLQPW